MIGEILSHYEVLEKLGEGGMGAVYKARDPRLDRLVAIKVLPGAMQGDDEARDSLQSEARAASALDHPNICTIHDFGETPDGLVFLAMAYYEGSTLESRLAAGPLDPDEVVRIALPIALGLEAAHAAGIVHRDIKPSNVFLTERGDVKILDFGIARRSSAGGDEANRFTGTPAYLPPEAVLGLAADHRGDLWAVGVLLYEMLAGRQPFEGDYAASVLYAIANDDPAPLPDAVPEPLRILVARLLEKEADNRPASATELVAVLEGVVATPKPSAAQPPKLPDPLNSFVGRDREIEVIKALLKDCRLVTLTGPGGSGKTRLSLRAAAQMAPEFSDGVYLVELAPISDPGLVLAALAGALGVDESAGATIADDVKEFLHRKRALLLLDNFEHVLDGASDIAAILEACPGVKALVTSRAPLGIGGEQEFEVPPLALPRSASTASVEAALASPAVQLFVDRAKGADLGFALTAANVADVTRICAALDGLPLAIELAAARTKLFPPKALAARLGRSLDLLKGSGRGRPARHRTLRQAIEWSYDLLEPHSQKFLQQLSCFAGGWTVEAAEGLCDDCEYEAVDQLAALGEHSLIRQIEGLDGEPRFELLETIKAFALERLRAAGNENQARARHFAYFLSLAERAAPELTGSEQGRWLDILESENDNFRAAFDWAEAAEDHLGGLALSSALWRFWISRRHIREGLSCMEPLLERSSVTVDPKARLQAVNGFATLCHYVGETRRACQVLTQSIEICQGACDRQSLATLLNNLAWTHSELSNLKTARRISNEALEVNQEVGDDRGVAVALNNLGWVANYEGRYREALDYHGRGLAIRRRIRDMRGVAFVLGSLAWAEQYHGDLERASALLDEAMEILAELKDEVLIAWIQKNRARVLRDQGDLQGVLDLLRPALESERHNHEFLLAWNRTLVGAILHELGDVEASREHLEAVRRYWERVEFRHGLAENLYESGRCELADDPALGVRKLLQSLRLRLEIGSLIGVAECLECTGAAPGAAPDLRTNVSVMAAADRIREELEIPAPERLRVSESVAALRAQLSPGEFEKAWEAGRRLTPEQAAELLPGFASPSAES